MNKDRQKKNKASLKQKVIVFLLGVVFTAIVLELGLRFAGQILLYLQDKKNQSSLSDPSAYRIICLGDSMTLNGGRYSYPRQLEDTLNNLKLGIKFRVINKGKIGLNSSGLMRGLGEDLRAYRPQMVIVMLGINDWYVKYYENIPDAKSFIFNNLKIFKLFRIFWTQMMDKKPVVKLAESLRTGRKGPVQEIISSNTEKKYFSLGYFFWSQGDLLEAQDAFKKAVELDPKNKKAYYELGRITRDLDMLEQSEAIFQKAIELDPKDIKSYLELGWACQLQDKLVQAEDLYKKAIKIAPEYFYSYLRLGFLYIIQNKYSQAEAVFKQAAGIELSGAEMDENKRMVLGALATLYQATGRGELADQYYRQASQNGPDWYGPLTCINYHKLKEALDQRGIKLVCVQYPVRSIESLRQVFSLGEQNEIIFVDNEEIFKAAIKSSSYHEYFVDIFCGDFGHCTPKGNKLLAENIAKALAQAEFKK